MEYCTNIKKNSRFLVTGGAGFIGSNLCEFLLKEGHKVRCMDNFSTGKMKNIDIFKNDSNYELFVGDIQNYETCFEACNGIDYVLHQAAWGSVPRSIEFPLKYNEINVKGTLNMLEASRRNNIKKFVYASSSSVYGDSLELPKKEGCEGELLSPYAITKKANEEYGILYKKMYGLDTYGLRYFNVFGKRQDPESLYAAVIPKFIKQLINNEIPTIYGDGSQSRDFTYIENVIEANLKACCSESSAGGRVYNIAYGSQISLLELYNILCQSLGKDIKPVFGSARKGDIKHSNADISKAKSMMGYNPKFSLNDGIKLTIEWYKENL